MKKPVSDEVRAKEAGFWERMKKVMKNPGTTCRK